MVMTVKREGIVVMVGIVVLLALAFLGERACIGSGPAGETPLPHYDPGQDM
jgi:hypothetical protein